MEPTYTLPEGVLEEAGVAESWNSPPVAELPTRGISGVAVFEVADGRLPMRDLEVLDDQAHPTIDVVGSLTKLDDDGKPVLDAEPGAPRPIRPTPRPAAHIPLSRARAREPRPCALCRAARKHRTLSAGPARPRAGPTVRLTNVPEWSVEYDELTVVLWVSTATADYKLISSAEVYQPFWMLLQRKAAISARAIALLVENANLTLKQLRAHIVKLNALPNQIQLRSDEFVMYAEFIAEQIAGAEGLAECRALLTLREQLSKSNAAEASTAAEAAAAAEPAAAGGDPNKRARKAPTSFLDELEKQEKERAARTPKKDAKDPMAPKPAQTAFAYFSKTARAELLKEAKAAGTETAGLDLTKLVAERWEAASAAEREPFEDTAEADHERYILETREHELQKLREANKSKKRPTPAKGMLACERDPTPAKRRKLEEAAAASAAAAATPGGGAGASSGTPGGEGGSGSGMAAPPSANGAGAGAGTPASASRGGLDETELTFPMEDAVLLRKEKAHRQMLVASGRSKPEEKAPKRERAAAEANGDGGGGGGGGGGGASSSSERERTEPRYVFPPKGTLAPERLPPMPSLPDPEPLTFHLGVAAGGVAGADDGVAVLWDFFNAIGHALKCRPLALPLAALENALRCGCALDYELATQLHCALLRTVATDYFELDGWGPFVKAVRDPLLPLCWPRVARDYFKYYMGMLPGLEEDEHPEADEFDARFGGGAPAAREQLVDGLSNGEWAALPLPLRLALLTWLVEKVAHCFTVHHHFDRLAEGAGAVRRDVQLQLDEEEAKQAEMDEARLQMADVQLKLVELAQQQQRRNSGGGGGGGGGGGARGASAAQTKHNAALAELTKQHAEMAKALRGLRARRLELQETLGSLSLRAEKLGADRHHREYLELGWPRAPSMAAPPQLLVRDRDGGWARLRGGGAVRALYGGLHAMGSREGALKTALRRHRLMGAVERAEAAAGDKAAQQAEEKLCKPHASKGLPPAFREGAVAAPAAPAAGSATGGIAGGTRNEVARDESDAAATPAPPEERPSDGATRAGAAERMRKLGAAVAARVATLPDDPLSPLDRPVLRAASAALAAMAADGAVAALAPLPAVNGATFEQARIALLEFEDRLVGAQMAWEGGVVENTAADAHGKALHRPWLEAVKGAALPVELGAALLVLDACIHAKVRTRLWGVDRSGKWRADTQAARTVADVALQLLDIDECCNWDPLEKELLATAARAPKQRKGGPAPPAVRRRVSVAEYGAYRGLRCATLEFCDSSPTDRALRARANGELFGLTPLGGGGWEWMSCGPAADALSVIDLRGLTVQEAKGALITVWYEEEKSSAKTGKTETDDKGYVGQVVGVSLQQKGLTVRFDVPGHVSMMPDGAGGEVVETMFVTNDDDWLWGLHELKPGFGRRIRDAHGAREPPPAKDVK